MKEIISSPHIPVCYFQGWVNPAQGSRISLCMPIRVYVDLLDEQILGVGVLFVNPYSIWWWLGNPLVIIIGQINWGTWINRKGTSSQRLRNTCSKNLQSKSSEQKKMHMRHCLPEYLFKSTHPCMMSCTLKFILYTYLHLPNFLAWNILLLELREQYMLFHHLSLNQKYL